MFIGNEAWHITDGEYVLLTDFPCQSGYSGYMSWDWPAVPTASGDTEEPLSLLAARRLDVAFVTPWMLAAVARQEAKIDARRVIVVHHEAAETVRPYARESP